MEEDDMVMRVGNSLRGKRDEPIREEGLQARGAYKEVPRASRRLALATPKSPWACTRVRAKITLTAKASIKDCYIIVNYSLTRAIILIVIVVDLSLFTILIVVILI